MKLYEQWIRTAYNERGEALATFWDTYLPLEQTVYEKLLEDKTTSIKGTVGEISEQLSLEPVLLTGFLDGINDATGNTINMEELALETKIDVTIDFEKLYKKMVEYKAEHLYELDQWENIFSADQLDSFYKEQKSSRTVIKDKKVGRNEPCPCGSGKKFKQCCGK